MSGKLLEEILSPDALSILVQPIIRVSDRGRKLHSIECLTRGPRGTLFERPDVLFDYVRRKKAELAVDWKVIELALRTCSEVPQSIGISINVHASSLGRDTEFVPTLLRHAEAVDMDIKRLSIEIVEHAPVWNQPQFRQNVASIKKLGVNIALDDVGAGQSNYHMILDTAPDCFKVDAFLVAGIESDPRRRAIVSSIAQLADQLGAKLIVEGVETEVTLSVLTDLGVEFMQGYLFSRPISVEQLLQSGWLPAKARAANLNT